MGASCTHLDDVPRGRHVHRVPHFPVSPRDILSRREINLQSGNSQRVSSPRTHTRACSVICYYYFYFPNGSRDARLTSRLSSAPRAAGFGEMSIRVTSTVTPSSAMVLSRKVCRARGFAAMTVDRLFSRSRLTLHNPVKPVAVGLTRAAAAKQHSHYEYSAVRQPPRGAR